MNKPVMQFLQLGICILILCVVNGCVSSQTKTEALGIKIGDKLQSRGEVVAYRCLQEEATSGFGMWFGGENKSVCLTLRQTALRYSYADVHPVQSGSTMEVMQIRNFNGVDRKWYMIGLRDVSDGKEYWVSDLGAENVFGLRRAR